MCIALNQSFSILDCITCMHYLHRDGEEDTTESVEVIISCSQLHYWTCTKKGVGRKRVRVCRKRKRRRNVAGTECAEMNKILLWIIHYLHALATPHTEHHSVPTTFSNPLDNQRVAQRHSATPQWLGLSDPQHFPPFFSPHTLKNPLQSQMITSISAS